MTSPDLPLAGIRVLDLSRALAGPFCTALLGDLGADIIKVEGLPAGDTTRHWPPWKGDRSLYYLSANRNKRSISLDLRAPEAQQVIAELLEGADVLVQNFRPGVLAKLGLDPEHLREVRPDLVVSGVTGFGEIGPMRDDAGLDQVAQGMSGLMSVTGAGENTPMRVGVPISDIVTGMVTAVGILASLVGRGGSGRAAHVSTSLLESSISLMTFQAQRYLSLGEVAEPQGNDHPLISPYGSFPTQDGNINVAVGTNHQWELLCALLEVPELVTDPDYVDPPLRSKNQRKLHTRLNELFRQDTSAHWIAGLRELGIPCGPIHTLDQVFADPQVRALEMVQPVGPEMDPIVRGPLWLDGKAPEIRRHPPAMGEHSREILRGLSYDEQRIDDLIGRGIVGEP
jgi:crotonobetainyl-CoA:carnitine CoA-transferase CaiB-like acyl-CoA transferase